MISEDDVQTHKGAVDHVGDADAQSSSADANYRIDNDESIVGTVTDARGELRWRRCEGKVNGTDDDPLAATSSERKRKRGKTNEGRNNTSNGGVIRDKGDVEHERIDREREDEKPGEVVEVAMVHTRSTPCANDVRACDDDNSNNNHKGTPRTALGWLERGGYAERGEPYDATDEVVSPPSDRDGAARFSNAAPPVRVLTASVFGPIGMGALTSMKPDVNLGMIVRCPPLWLDVS